MTDGLWRLALDGRVTMARCPVADGPAELLDVNGDVEALLGGGTVSLTRALEGRALGPVPGEARVLPPVSRQEVWACGVTFERSRATRNEESAEVDVYDRVYTAERPELFFKSAPERVRATGDPICIRPDSRWDVPEPELTLVVDGEGDIVAYTLGNDVSSRSIEGENPLYLPQAKVYEGSCALGPCLVPVDVAPPVSDVVLELRVERAGATVYSDAVPLTGMRRSLEELVRWLMRGLRFPLGVALMTGTSIVPPSDFTLVEGDAVSVAADGLGVLRNRVEMLPRSQSGN